MAIDIFTPLRRVRAGLIGVEKVMLIYWTLTTAFMFVLFDELSTPWTMLGTRLAILAGLAAFVGIYHFRPCRFTFLLRNVYQLALLAYWYTDTYNFNQIFPNLDHVFAYWEQALWGFQPSIVLPKVLNNLFWSEAFNLGYFAYYPMIAFVVLVTFFKRYHRFEKTVFILLTSFFAFYIIFMILPVAGPQYYFQAVGLDSILSGKFPEVGDYFRYHNELLPSPHNDGLFYYFVEATQASGERPTAAFPSSHVGISTILMVLAFKSSHKLFWCIMPFYVLLCISTVYIQAHYAIDSIAGFVAAFPVYQLAHFLYYTKYFHRPSGGVA